MDVTALASETARRLYAGSPPNELLDEVNRIAARKGGTPMLAGESLVVAGLIVQVCVITLEVAKMVASFKEMQRRDQLLEVMKVLIERTGDRSLTNNQNAQQVLNTALDTMSAHDAEK